MTDDAERDKELWAAAEEGAELMSEGDHAGAIRLLSRVVADQPKNHYALFFLGSALLEEREAARALKAFLGALQLKPDYPGALIGAGWALHTLGRFREGVRVARQVLAKEKDDPDALYLAGLCHYAMGDNAAAQTLLERFVSTRPELEVAMEADAIIKILRGQVVDGRDPDNDEEDA